MKSVSGKEFCKVLRRKGWRHIQTRGSHQRWENPDGVTVIVPVHANQSLKKGLQIALMKQAELSEADF